MHVDLALQFCQRTYFILSSVKTFHHAKEIETCTRQQQFFIFLFFLFLIPLRYIFNQIWTFMRAYRKCIKCFISDKTLHVMCLVTKINFSLSYYLISQNISQSTQKRGFDFKPANWTLEVKLKMEYKKIRGNLSLQLFPLEKFHDSTI